MRVLIELTAQVGVDGSRGLPDWAVGLECPRCSSTDIDADRTRLLASAVEGGIVRG